MFLAQLAEFLITHHHAAWVPGLFTSNHAEQLRQAWAARHGFVFQP